MKINSLSSVVRLLLLVPAAALIQLPLHAGEDSTTTTVKLSSPGKPATLRIDMPWADIHITGTDGDTVTVESALSQKGGKDTRDDGLRRLDDEVSFELHEKDNIVSLTLAGENPWTGGTDADFKISIPRRMALDIKTETGGDLEVKEVAGDIEINNMNGEVKLEGISGSAVVNTVNGEVHAVYAQAPQKLVSITSMNGEIDLRVPADTKANVRLRTHNGSILTDFDEAVLKTKSEGKSYGGSDAARMGAEAARSAADAVRVAVEVAQEFARGVEREVERATKEGANPGDIAPPQEPRAPKPPRPPHPPMPPITGGKLVSGTLNGGGVDIKISSMNGEITLRQTSPAPTATSKPTDKVTVIFQDPDNFTDVRDSHTNMTSTDDLDELRDTVRKSASRLLANGNTLVVTFLDLDLAGQIRPDQNNVRVMSGTTIPRAHLKFQLRDTGGQIVKEGERKLSDLNYQDTIRTQGPDDPLIYDKQLLKDWITKEFSSKS